MKKQNHISLEGNFQKNSGHYFGQILFYFSNFISQGFAHPVKISAEAFYALGGEMK